MAELKNIIEERRSIRKFTDEAVPKEDIIAFIKAATNAPSGCNSQCWHFTALTSRQSIEKLSAAVEKGVRKFYADCDEDFITSRIKQSTFFRKAPLVMLVFRTHLEYHDPRVTQYYASKGYSPDRMNEMMGGADILSIGAAVENMLLTIHDMGYGACWMVDPVAFSDEINEAFGFPTDRKLASVIPIGKPAYKVWEKKMKDFDTIYDIL